MSQSIEENLTEICYTFVEEGETSHINVGQHESAKFLRDDQTMNKIRFQRLHAILYSLVNLDRFLEQKVLTWEHQCERDKPTTT